MRDRFVSVALLLGLVVVLAVAVPAPSLDARPIRTAAEPFEIDMAHSTLIYRIRHFGVSWFYGRVQKPKGEFLIDVADLDASFIRVTLEMKNMDAGNKSRDQFLKSPDFFNVKEFPTATFMTTAIRKTDTGALVADGAFTMHGVTKSISVPIRDYAEAKTERFGYRAGFECIFTVKRSDYGIDLFVEEGTLGDETRITVSLEGVRR